MARTWRNSSRDVTLDYDTLKTGHHSAMALSAASTTPLGMFDCHHIVHVEYPCLGVLKPHQIACQYRAVDRAQRYEPLPLIPDAAVEAHAYRSSAEETAFFALIAAREAQWSDRSSFEESPRDATGLQQDMERLTRFRGVTASKMCTFRGDDNRLWLRVDHEIRLWGSLGFPREYEFRWRDFVNLSGKDKLWHRNIVDLVERRSDRAVLHVRQQLDAQEQQQLDEPWKCPRHPDYRQAFVGRIQQITAVELAGKSEEERQCCMCLCADDELDQPVDVVLSCSDQHICHTSCLVRWCQEKGPDKADCPHCRRTIIVDETTLDQLKFGVVEAAYS